jgi:serine protease inhibitor
MFNYILVFCLGIGLLQCAKKAGSLSSSELEKAQKRLVNSNNQFGFKLFKEIVPAEKDKNVFISPLSISMALGMTYNGADGSTKEAMETTLELSGLTIQEVNESYKSMIKILKGLDPKVKFQIANSIWYRQDWTFEKEFLSLCNTYFNAKLSGLDFSDPNASGKVMNGWVDKNTNGKIKEIIDPDEIDQYTMMFLINAIYFKGTWTYEFDEKLTSDDWFMKSDAVKKPCKMMKQKGDFQYLETDDFQAIDLPYGNGKFSMTIFLPKPDKTVDWLITELSPGKWGDWIDAFHKVEVTLYLPKFKLEYGLTLNDVLKALGMGIAFDIREANFSKMRKQGDLYIDKVKHKTFVEVDEEGTEAAAATSVQMALKGAPGFVIRVDRPFVFVIRENSSQTILFIGKIVEPTLD